MDNLRKTKIVCTLGPASDTTDKICKMIEAGMNVARLNFSHGTHEEHLAKINAIKEARKIMGTNTAIMLDTKGPEIRTGSFESETFLEQGQKFTLTTDDVIGNKERCSISYKKLYRDIKPGSLILIDDGLIELSVQEIDDEEIVCTVVNSGTVNSHKGINVPGVRTKLPAMTQKDYDDLVFGTVNGIDIVAASFIRRASDVHEIRGVLNGNGGRGIMIVSKIENVEGVENIDEIIAASDGIMVARGDLGVEVPQQRVPILQKEMIKKCNKSGKPVITATQMLDSMTRNPRPTRAEVADVANAVYDGTDAIMLSGETAVGKYPVEAVKCMNDIAVETENSINYYGRFRKNETETDNTITNAIAHSTCECAHVLSAAAILAPTTSGHTAKSIARFRPQMPIIACVYNEDAARHLALVCGVHPVIIAKSKLTEEIMSSAVEAAKKAGYVNPKDVVVITAGVPAGIEGNTNIMKIERV